MLLMTILPQPNWYFMETCHCCRNCNSFQIELLFQQITYKKCYNLISVIQKYFGETKIIDMQCYTVLFDGIKCMCVIRNAPINFSFVIIFLEFPPKIRKPMET